MAKKKFTAKTLEAGAKSAHPATEAKLVGLIQVIDHGRSKVYIAAQALGHGETDLELQCAAVLSDAFDEINEAYDELLSLRIYVQTHEQEAVRG